MLKDECPIWGTYAVSKSLFKEPEQLGTHARYVVGYHIESWRTGGSYGLDIEAYHEVGSSSYSLEKKLKLTSWIVDQRKFGSIVPIVTSEILGNIAGSKRLSVLERSNRLLRFIVDQSSSISSRFHFYPSLQSTTTERNQDYELLAVTESISKEEVEYLLIFLSDLGFIKGSPDNSRGRIDYVVSPRGHQHLEELSMTLIDSSQGFVAMWFDESMAEVYLNGIEAAITSVGYSAKRIDKVNHNNKIDDEIIAEIRRSRFLIADFTHDRKGARGGVYYEAGFAHGLNKPVIFMVRKDCLQKVHFDTRQYNHIVWENAEDLRIQLSRRISASIGEGPLLGHKLKRN